MPSTRFPSPCGVWVVSGTTGPRPTAHSFCPLAGCGLFRGDRDYFDRVRWFPSPCGVWVVSVVSWKTSLPSWFPSPCGVWVVSQTECCTSSENGFRPLAGCGLFRPIAYYMLKQVVSVPLRGVGCFRVRRKAWTSKRFPSPCGVWVVSLVKAQIEWVKEFPSPCGVWVVSRHFVGHCGFSRVSVPLRGVGCFKL